MPRKQFIVRLSDAEKAELVERCERLGISVADALRRGALSYLRTLELAAEPAPRPGRSRKETATAAAA